MNRPSRKHRHLTEKIADKLTRARKQGDSTFVGKKLKQWRKDHEKFQTLVQ